MPITTFTSTKDAVAGQLLTQPNSLGGWNGKSVSIQVGAGLGGLGTTYKHRGFVHFPINWAEIASVNSATLVLTNRAASSAWRPQSSQLNLIVARSLVDFGEGDTTPTEGQLSTAELWNWQNMLDKYDTTTQYAFVVPDGAEGTTVNLVITDIVKQWRAGLPNYGLVLICLQENNATSSFLFHSQNDVTGEPKLNIDYNEYALPTPPTLVSPEVSSISNDFTPDFTVDSNVIPVAGGGFTGLPISQVLYRVWEADGRWLFSTSTASPPLITEVRLNHLNPSNATKLYVSETAFAGSVAPLMNVAYNNNTIMLVDDIAEGGYATGRITNMVDSGTYRTFDWQFIEGQNTAFISNGTSVAIVRTGNYVWYSYPMNVGNGSTSVTKTYGTHDSVLSPGAAADRPLQTGKFYFWTAQVLLEKATQWTAITRLVQFRVNTLPAAPTVTILSVPVNDVPDISPSFNVQHNDPDPGDTLMTAYQILVDRWTGSSWVRAWDSGVADISGAPQNSITTSSINLTWGTEHRVTARTRDSLGGWSTFAGWKIFTTHKAIPPINLDPSNGELSDPTPVFTFSRGSTVDTITSYEINVYSSDLATTKWASGVQTSGIIGGANVTRAYGGSALLDNTDYIWEARVTSTVGGTSNYTARQKFRVIDPTQPSAVSPKGAGITTLTPNIVFTRTGVFNRIQIQVYPFSSTTEVLGTPIRDSGTRADSDADTVITGAGPTTATWTYSGTALAWETPYKYRGRVSNDGGVSWSNWSGLVNFKTDEAGVAVQVSPAADAWITDTTPDFTISRSGADVMDKIRIRLYNETRSVLIWDSGIVDVANTTSATTTYNGSSLVPGTTYVWNAQYQKTTGPWGDVSSPRRFRLNGAPKTPSNLFPYPDYVYLAGGETINFEAMFDDPDITAKNDRPTAWDVVVETESGTPFATVVYTAPLFVGVNKREWSGPTLSNNVDYRWKTRFRDSLNVYGPYSGYRSFVIATPPDGDISTPSNDSNVNVTRPFVTWNYTGGGTQLKFRIRVVETNASGIQLAGGERLDDEVTSAAHSYQLPGGTIRDGRYYDIILTVTSDDNLTDPSPSKVNIFVELDAPNPVTGVSATAITKRSLIRLDWKRNTLKTNHTFVEYNIYRRLVDDNDWQLIGSRKSIGQTRWDDWYAGNSVAYQYRVTVVTRKGSADAELESPDHPGGGSFSESILDADDWTVVGADRAPIHTINLHVDEEDHNRPIQQESFESLGSDRKVIIRGFVLGNEGTISTFWANEVIETPYAEEEFINETIMGRRLIDYLTFNKGPHLLKSPFGDVWEVQFQSPNFKWSSGGHLTAELPWIETGQTSQVSI